MQRFVDQENELLVDPTLFHVIKDQMPQINRVEIHLKRGHFHNELTRFRYDVILGIGDESATLTQFDYRDWQQQGLTIDSLRELLKESHLDSVCVRRIPNARVLSDVRGFELIRSGARFDTVENLRQALREKGKEGVDPEDVWALGETLSYSVLIRWSEPDSDSCFDAIFHRTGAYNAPASRWVFPRLPVARTAHKPLRFYANDPLKQIFSAHLASKLRSFLADKLPDYMTPSAFVILSELPLTANGKLDKRALPAPEHSRRELEDFIRPRTPNEELVAGLWEQVLGVERVGAHDNFFDLGGHSLQATQIISRVRKLLKVDVPLSRFFASPTVAGLAAAIEHIQRQGLGLGYDSIKPVPRDKELPLSFAQQRMWFLNQLEPDNPFYNIVAAYRSLGNLNPGALRESVNEIVRRHESLRTYFKSNAGQPSQVIVQRLDINVPLVDLSVLPEDERNHEASQLMAGWVRQAFNLAEPPLLRIELLRMAKDDHILLLNMHHIISDGWSMGVLLDELVALYKGYLSGKAVALPELLIQYPDFAAWQREWLQGEVLEAQLSYWRQRLSGDLPVLELPTDFARPVTQRYRGCTNRQRIESHIADGLRQVALREGATLFMTLLAAFKTLLYRYTRQTDIVVGSPIANRNRVEIEPLIGFFVNTLALRSNPDYNTRFVELLAQVREVTLGAYVHQDLPFEKIVEELQPERSLNRQPIFQVMFALQNAWMGDLELSGASLTRIEIDTGTAQFDLAMDVYESSDGLVSLIEYNTDLFDHSTISRIQAHFRTLLSSIASDPHSLIAHLNILTPAERDQLLLEWNHTSRHYDLSLCLHEAFQYQARIRPEAIALVGDRQRLTYRQLNERANSKARLLVSNGVGPEVCVGLCMQRSVEAVEWMLAILKSGGVYVPMDPSYPQQRLAYMADDAGLKVVIVGGQQDWDDTQWATAQVINSQEASWQLQQYGREDVISGVDGENLAYVIYTSGTTGRPKGIGVPHRAAINTLLGFVEAHSISERDVMLQFSKMSFDVVMEELFGVWIAGGRAVMRPGGAELQQEQMWEEVRREGVTILNLPASYWYEWVSDMEERGEVIADSVRLVIAGNEKSVPEGLERWRRVVGERVEWVNAYGPTEGPITVTNYYSRGKKLRSGLSAVPIGRPVGNTRIYILDERENLVPVGVTGEIYIGREAMVRGYYNRADETAERFVPDAYSREGGERLYRTGDFGRYGADGEIEYVGRGDEQVKIRGYRIEVGEVEAVLNEQEGVKEGVVEVREMGRGDKRLVGYYVARGGMGEVSGGEIREYMRGRLPEYMVPGIYVRMERMPVTEHDKIDRKALPDPQESDIERSIILPRDTLELRLTQIWEEVLGIHPVGIRDNFFELGGHSFLAVRLMARIHNLFGKDLPLSTLFQAQTVEKLATLLRRGREVISRSPLIAIQPHGSKPPFFCIHPAGGNILCYAELAHHLGADQPVYALQSPGLDGQMEPYTRVEDLAAHYIKAAQEVVPDGPYLLGGWSMGGVVAFEMARRLESQGRQVALLALLDSYVALDQAPDTDDLTLLLEFISDLENLMGISLSLTVETLRQLNEDEQLKYALDQAVSAGLLPPETGLIQLQRLLQVYKANSRAMMIYRPKVYSGQAVLFRADDEAEITAEEQVRQWREIVTGDFEVHTMRANHYTILRQPQVNSVAEKLKAYFHNALEVRQASAKS